MRGRSLVFSLVFGVVYTICFYFTSPANPNWALFRFYPSYSQFSIAPLGREAGPAILWYGWMGYALLAGLAAAFIVPPRLSAKLSPTVVWVATAALLLAITVYERTWFL
jgi:hypothetical protein